MEKLFRHGLCDDTRAFISDYYSNVIWQGYETAGFETQFLEDAIEHAYQLVQKQEREGDSISRACFIWGAMME